MYSNELFHRGALSGYPLAATLDTIRRMAATEPGMDHSSTYDMLWWGYMRLGNEGRAEEALRNREGLGLPPGDTYKGFQELGLYARFQPWMADLGRWWELRNPMRNDGADSQVLTAGDDDGCAERGDRLRSDPGKRGLTNEQREAHCWAGQKGTSCSAFAMAFLLLDSANGELESPELELQKREWAVHLFTLGLVDDTALVAASRAWLADSAPPGAARVRALYALGRDALFTGDTARADTLLAVLAAAPDTTPTASRHAALLAQSCWARGNPEGARTTEVIYLRDTTTVRLSPFEQDIPDADPGRWQEQLRRHNEAEKEWLWHENADFEGWPMGVPQEGEIDAVLSPYARLIRARHAVKYGNLVVACRHLQRVRELWHETEPVMRPFVASADSAWSASCR